MALPWLTEHKSSGISIDVRKPDENSAKGNSDEDGLKAAAKDLRDAIESKDDSRIASALRAAFEILDSEPHSEGPHTNEDDSES